MKNIANVVSIAGVDPSGGAGIFADLKTFSALGAYGCGVVVAITAQNTRGVTGVALTDPAFVAQQINTLFDDVQISAVKIGMLGSAPLISTVAQRLRAVTGPTPIVLDPVMIAKSGHALLEADATDTLIQQLVPMATVITPNLPEAGVLLNERHPETLDEMRVAADKLRGLMTSDQAWVLLKGGHLSGDTCTDLLCNGEQQIELPANRIETTNTHGTGCTYSAAIAALLAQGHNMTDAVWEAKQYLTAAIATADQLSVGDGHGPVNHFHLLWQ